VVARNFGITDLARILTEAAGGGDELDFEGDVLDTEFDDLGYDSLAMLETAARIEREFRVTLEDSAITDAATPRALVELVNRYLAVPEAS
jgi:act minimal PKS acyl carrier protein